MRVSMSPYTATEVNPASAARAAAPIVQAARADGQIAKKQQELQLKLHEQAKISLVSP